MLHFIFSPVIWTETVNQSSWNCCRSSSYQRQLSDFLLKILGELLSLGTWGMSKVQMPGAERLFRVDIRTLKIFTRDSTWWVWVQVIQMCGKWWVKVMGNTFFFWEGAPYISLVERGELHAEFWCFFFWIDDLRWFDLVMRLGQSFTPAFLKLLDSGLLNVKIYLYNIIYICIYIYPDIYIDGPDGCWSLVCDIHKKANGTLVRWKLDKIGSFRSFQTCGRRLHNPTCFACLGVCSDIMIPSVCERRKAKKWEDAAVGITKSEFPHRRELTIECAQPDLFDNNRYKIMCCPSYGLARNRVSQWVYKWWFLLDRNGVW